MENAVEYEGIWWLPGQDEPTVSGTLRYDPLEGITLDTLGLLVNGGAETAENVDVIIGISSNGKQLSLINCLERCTTNNRPGIKTQQYIADLLAINLHVERKSDLKLHRLGLGCTDLSAWVDRHGFTISDNLEEGIIGINYKQPEPVRAVLSGGFELTVGTSVKGPSRGWPQKEAIITETDWLFIRSDREIGFDQLWMMASRLRDFLSLAVGHPVFITEVSGQSEKSKVEIRGHTYYNKIQILLSQRDKPEKHRPIDRPNKVLLPLAEVEEQLGNVLSRWFERSELLSPALDLYFSTLYEPCIHLERHFLFLAQAIETYHRRISDTTDLPPDEHENRCKAILDTVPSQYKDWLDGKLEYSNELSFRRRIKALVGRFKDVLEGYIDRKPFAHKVYVTRNWLTHYDEKQKAQAAKGLDLLDLIYKLRSLLEASFLSEIGLTNEEIKRILHKQIQDRQHIIESN